MAGLQELREPIEVYEAAVGKPERLIAYLRSDEYIGEWMREALAAYLAGELEPRLPRGRPKKRTEKSKRMQLAAFEYSVEVYWAKKEGTYVHGSAVKTRAEIAENYGLIPEQFEQEFRRGIPRETTVFGPQARFLDWYINHYTK